MKTYLITPTWNCGQEFARCAASVMAATHRPLWWVVVENGSRREEREPVEAALEGLREFHGPVHLATYVRNETNLGIPVAQNQALARIRANEDRPFGVVFLSADTVVTDGWIGRVLAFAEAHPDAGVIGGAKGPQGAALPVFHDQNGRWYQHTRSGGPVLSVQDMCLIEGETVDFSMAYVRPEVMARGLRFDTGYEIYDGYDQDLCFRVRSWGYRVFQVDAGVVHYGSAAMKKAGYRWAGGGRAEWDALRARNLERFVSIWGNWLRPRRQSIESEKVHLQLMNQRLVAEAGHRKAVPSG